MNQTGAARCTILFLGAAAAGCGAPSSAPPPPAPPPVAVPSTTPAPVPYVPVSPSLPPIPAVEGPISLSVIHPSRSTPRPRVDSTIIYGSVGTEGAGLHINGVEIPVAPNGAFVAYLPLPADGAWRLEAWKGEMRDTLTRAYRPSSPSASTGSAGSEEEILAPRAATVVDAADTLWTGSDGAYGTTTPGGDYRWFFPRGTRLNVVERRASRFRVALDSATTAWVDAADLALADTAPRSVSAMRPVRVRTDGAAPSPRIRVSGADRAPFLVEAEDEGRTVVLTVYGTEAARPAEGTSDAWMGRAVAERGAGGSLRVRIPLATPLWGWRAWFDGADLVVELRRPPAIDPVNPLRGIRVVIDPGHPPAGATGPTGLYEGDANLAIALPLAEILRERGAEVVLTRTTRESLELAPRVETAVTSGGHLLVSVHNNAFGEGQDPFRTHHTVTYYFHPFAAPLARAVERELAAVTGLRDAGARRGNLALARPSWLPSILTESLFMPIPEQEAALRDPAFVRRLAEAHARGIEAFLRERAASPSAPATP